ncbi:putative short chain dehydrogenase [Actinacidiphila reveromycinica]|uniref:Putative short chain dehydrogenase n=1 Tax=Actinacidiphila reveromycinica TaxID=659352 RepID=A0A7U3UX26_9ACTN|nr:SDR family oxidoreductase [Streptomyces sp. SN-593]BBB01836.1 putative short chain dehydrogenase [Streptomyces sp. SN-593]
MKIDGSVALVTGGNRGIGEQFVKELLDRGAARVYAAARDPRKVAVPGAVPLTLDITDPASVRAAAEQAGDVTLLVNNAGIATGASVLDGDLADFRREFDTHVFGTLAVSRAFAPVLARNGGGGLLNVLSALSWVALPASAAYCAAKSAEWSLTNALRVELAAQGTQVTGLHMGYVDTDLTTDVQAPKSHPADIVRAALDGFAAGDFEVTADDTARQVKAALSAGAAALYPRLTAAPAV